jgi:NAD(P)-dependent dehydrogenase (short-subunit alcohol dehydrogenase family)
MTDKKIWFVTGAGRGLGVDIAKAALAAGHAVVATGRDATKVTKTVGVHEDLLSLKLDILALSEWTIVCFWPKADAPTTESGGSFRGQSTTTAVGRRGS